MGSIDGNTVNEEHRQWWDNSTIRAILLMECAGPQPSDLNYT